MSRPMSGCEISINIILQKLNNKKKILTDFTYTACYDAHSKTGCSSTTTMQISLGESESFENILFFSQNAFVISLTFNGINNIRRHSIKARLKTLCNF